MLKHWNILAIVFIILACLFSGNILLAQNNTCSERYRSKVFRSVEFHGNQDFNAWTKYHGGPTLRYDVYAPKGDTASLRPLIILWHGGAFIDAIKKNSPDILDLAKDLAKMGYVVITPDYRGLTDLKGFSSEEELIKIVVKSTLDANDLVCHVLSEIDNGNPYRINKNEMFGGGSSAGSVIGLHGIFLNNTDDLGERYVNWAREVDEGRVDNVLAQKFCGQGNILKGFFNISGALVDTNFIQSTNVNFLHIHGTEDQFVPFDYGAPLFGATAAPNMYGSKRIHEKCKMLGIDSEFMIFEKGGHVPFLNLDIKDLVTQVSFIDKNKYNRVLNGIAEFLFKQIDCEKTASPTAIKEVKSLENNIYPNPIQNSLQVNMQEFKAWNLQIFDLSGKKLLQNNFNGSYIHQDVSSLPGGLHIIQVFDIENQDIYTGKFLKQ